SDLNFDLALSGLSASELSSIRVVYIDSPKNGQIFYNPTSLTITAQAKTGSGTISAVAFFAGTNQIGQDYTAPYQYVWNNPPQGNYSLTAVGVMGGKMYTSSPVQIQITSPALQPQPVEVDLIAAGSVWYYLATNANAPSNWYTLNFDHSKWRSGPAELGYGEGDEATRIPYGSDSNNKWITTYFRKFFIVNDPSAITNLVLNLKRDDGAVVYLNGVEVVRDLLPDGEITWSTLADNAPDDGQTFNTFIINQQLLLNGTNSIAVEIHQNTPSSSDLSFDLSLIGYASTNRDRGIWITTPTNYSEFASFAIVRISADVVVGGDLSVSNVDFYSDGSLIYTITGRNPVYSFDTQNLLPGVHQIYAIATDSAGLTITSAPVQITINRPPMPSALVSFGDKWKYLDNGSNQGSTWRNLNYDDRNWKSGYGKFGYGNDGELTVVSYGTNSNSRYITTYFRKTFTVSNPSQYSALMLNIIRDDGVVVYINGSEVFRDNMLDGVVSFNSLALRTIEPKEENVPIQAIIPANLVSGTNIIAVEIHQVNISSSDIGFDMEMVGLTETTTTNGIYLTSPYNGANLLIGHPVVMQSFAISGTNTIYKVDYYVNNSKIGESFNPPYQLAWNPPSNGTYLIKANAIFSSARSIISAPVSINVLTPSDPVEPISVKLIEAESDWKYWDNSQAVASGWQMLNFDDSNWQYDYARFGYGYDGEKTTLTDGRITHYFRKTFVITNIAMFTELEFQLQRDDGAVVYLNGKEVFRSNMPSETITASTLANTTVNTPDETTWFTTTVSTEGLGLINGTNIVAVELHQSSSTSTDAGFDLQLTAYGDTAGRVIILNPLSGSSYLITDSIPINFTSWAGYTNPIQKTELYLNGIKLTELAGANTLYNWTTLLPGEHTIIVRSYAASGKYYDSKTVNVIVGLGQVSYTLISSNSVWKYLDDGSNQGEVWKYSLFDDSLWKSGNARLGYGGDGEVTLLNSGPSTNKYITYYFRRQFTVPSDVTITNLSFYLLVDDGAVVYVDGAEMFRQNMPQGTINYLTTASSNIGGTDEQKFNLTQVNTILNSGTHIIAVEVHQSSANSTDLGFDLALYGYGLMETFPNVEATVSKRSSNIEISVPSMYGDWRVFGYTNIIQLLSGNGVPVPFTLIESNNQKYYLILPTEPIQF
ncbi:MAG TPA: Ig-like domain-containing protein, partial [Verrucomicrobiota bacterium]|nr:Ig-like domain-containing protein [Verrucomicrobiota bacterium]